MALTDSPFEDCVRAYVRGNGGFYPLVPACYGALRTAYEAGKPFFTAATIDGDEVTIKLGELEAVMLCTVASIERAVQRRKSEEKANESENFS